MIHAQLSEPEIAGRDVMNCCDRLKLESHDQDDLIQCFTHDVHEKVSMVLREISLTEIMDLGVSGLMSFFEMSRFDSWRMVSCVRRYAGGSILNTPNTAAADISQSQADHATDAAPQVKDMIAVCFFGQVKNYSHVASSVQEHIFSVLETEHFSIEIYAHTFNETSFTNPRNQEANLTIDFMSLENTLSASGEYKVSVVYDPVSAADQSMDVRKLLQHGDPWPDNPALSVRNLVRQLYSLQRLTQLWAPRARRYKYCLYLRPDLLFWSDLDLRRARPHLDAGALVTPAFDQNEGLNDRLALGTPAVMRAYGARADGLLDYVLGLGRPPHAETYLLHAMAARGVRNVDSAVSFERVRADGRLD
jgi:hypothetical protein